MGSSTWGLGDLQDDWLPYESLSGMDLTGRKAAVFGTGDQRGFSDTYVDALATLAEALEKAGATLIGAWPAEG
jgi:flavodoxin I